MLLSFQQLRLRYPSVCIGRISCSFVRQLVLAKNAEEACFGTTMPNLQLSDIADHRQARASLIWSTGVVMTMITVLPGRCALITDVRTPQVHTQVPYIAPSNILGPVTYCLVDLCTTFNLVVPTISCMTTGTNIGGCSDHKDSPWAQVCIQDMCKPAEAIDATCSATCQQGQSCVCSPCVPSTGKLVMYHSETNIEVKHEHMCSRTCSVGNTCSCGCAMAASS